MPGFQKISFMAHESWVSYKSIAKIIKFYNSLMAHSTKPLFSYFLTEILGSIKSLKLTIDIQW